MARPKKLQALVVESLINQAMNQARQVVKDAVLAKLHEHGIPVEGFPIDAFVEHLESGSPESFRWAQGTPGMNVSLVFTPEEDAAIQEKLDKLQSMFGSESIENVLHSAAKALLKGGINDIPELKAHERTDLYGFRQRLELRWGKAIDLYRLMLTISRELFSTMDSSLRESKATTGIVLREVLLGIHARTLRTGSAVLVLLEHGMADEAYARWRTLYELSVIAAFLSEHGEEAACMYRDHEFVANMGRIHNSTDWGTQLGTKKQRSEVTQGYHYVIRKYGDGFKRPYGWASQFLGGNKNPKFVDLERAIKGRQIVPPYKESSFQVHGGRAGLLGLGSLDGSTATTTGSNAGIEIPVMHSSLAVMQVTTTTMFHSPARDVVVMKMLMLLDERIHREARRAAKQLESDHQGSEA